ncbi:MAG TPA: four-carbon acid sugar kinase family protein [Thiobacillaceae bacterium]|nr:four-carbon acid sugar kinase family protein [Thiobacillaceae bacterium]HNU65045.1 four-carbon acid sugar kinase family protein [Thiobacillaceae bacterium]
MADTKIIVLDDDPTGSQTVHGCLLLTRWDAATLRQALQDPSPIFFVLTNTRALGAGQAEAITREVCGNLKLTLADLAAEGRMIHPLFVSRSDSTLRGHYPVETDVMTAELGGFDAHFLTPAFFEGGRITRDSTHYLLVDGKPVPTSETEFARDSVFGYSTSHLPDYVAEKTRGRIPAAQVERFLLRDIRAGVADRLMSLKGNACCVVDAETQEDMSRFAADVLLAVARGKRFLFRSAASLLTALARLPPQPVAPEGMGRWVRGGHPGAVVMGSHVRKSTRQLQALLREPDAVPVEVDVDRLLADRPSADRDALLAEVLDRARRIHARGATPVIFTSRQERAFSDEVARLAFGKAVSALLMDVVRDLPRTTGWLISKGGITSNDTLSQGLALASARVLGQILPGVSVVRCPDDHPGFPGMPVAIFPGNVGGDDALRTAFLRLSRKEARPMAA